MKRREVLRNICLATIGASLFPSCEFETFQTYEHLPLQKKQLRLIREIQKVILPVSTLEEKIEETPLHFMLSRINACYSKADIQKYLTGLKSFEQYITKLNKDGFQGEEPKRQLEILSATFTDDKVSSDLSYFLEHTKDLTVQHLTKSRYYYTTHYDYQFMPGRYIGCTEN